MKKILVTGASGLIGSNVCHLFLQNKWEVIGIDNNMRQKFFGKAGSTLAQEKLLEHHPHYHHLSLDIRNFRKLTQTLNGQNFDLIVHCAAQPSHDKAKEIPRLDFEVNAVGTFNMLEYLRQFQPQAVFVFTSTNKVYGDNPNTIPLVEGATRYSYADGRAGIDESLSIDQNTHSLFGAGKLAADVYVQEYGRYFGLKTAVLRLGCVTGQAHASVKLHGFLNYLIKSLLHTGSYEIIGYHGKQVRDQIDATDVANLMMEIYKKPVHGEVFNVGGGPTNSTSVWEAIHKIENKLGIQAQVSYEEVARIGDHICYITDLTKVKSFYPEWHIRKNLDQIIDEIIESEKKHA